MLPVTTLIVLSLTFLLPFVVPVVCRAAFPEFELITSCQLLLIVVFTFVYIKKKKIPVESYFYLKSFLSEKLFLTVFFIILKVPASGRAFGLTPRFSST